MPRQPRYYFPGAVLHVVQRGNDRAPVFTCAEERRDVYRRSFGLSLPEETVKAIRDATQFEWALGDAPFRTRVEACAGRRADRLPRGRPRSSGETKNRL